MAVSKTDIKTHPTRGNLNVVILCLILVTGMGGLAYASVPLYQIFCQVTGYGGTPQRVDTVDGIELSDRVIKVRFDANTATDLNWNFRPVEREVSVRLGEKIQISYVAENLSSQPITGMATFNVTPQSAGVYFNKIECFCFTDTRIAPGEKLDMPVVFFVDPELDEEKFMKALQTITLSYTFFASDEEPQGQNQVKLDQDAGETADQKL